MRRKNSRSITKKSSTNPTNNSNNPIGQNNSNLFEFNPLITQQSVLSQFKTYNDKQKNKSRSNLNLQITPPITRRQSRQQLSRHNSTKSILSPTISTKQNFPSFLNQMPSYFMASPSLKKPIAQRKDSIGGIGGKVKSPGPITRQRSKQAQQINIFAQSMNPQQSLENFLKNMDQNAGAMLGNHFQKNQSSFQDLNFKKKQQSIQLIRFESQSQYPIDFQRLNSRPIQYHQQPLIPPPISLSNSPSVLTRRQSKRQQELRQRQQQQQQQQVQNNNVQPMINLQIVPYQRQVSQKQKPQKRRRQKQKTYHKSKPKEYLNCGGQMILINKKQIKAIKLRREKRMREYLKQPVRTKYIDRLGEKDTYIHFKRHKHAVTRKRYPKGHKMAGQFISKKHDQKMKQLQQEKDVTIMNEAIMQDPNIMKKIKRDSQMDQQQVQIITPNVTEQISGMGQQFNTPGLTGMGGGQDAEAMANMPSLQLQRNQSSVRSVVDEQQFF